MIRKFQKKDMETVLKIWLEASIKAHNFIEADFWKEQVQPMREIYIPNSETYVYEVESNILGFYSLFENTLAAISVLPASQGQGIGQQLIAHAKTQRNFLHLNVYKENEKTYQFYLLQGFQVVSEQKDQHTNHTEYTMKYEKNR